MPDAGFHEMHPHRVHPGFCCVPRLRQLDLGWLGGGWGAPPPNHPKSSSSHWRGATHGRMHPLARVALTPLGRLL
jgi:hypothetical protein